MASIGEESFSGARLGLVQGARVGSSTTLGTRYPGRAEPLVRGVLAKQVRGVRVSRLAFLHLLDEGNENIPIKPAKAG